MEKQIQILFPTPIMKTKFPAPFTKEQLELIHQLVKVWETEVQ